MIETTLSEGVHYELVPVDADNEQSWSVRFLEGPYPETVIRYGNIAFDADDDCLKFNFVIHSTPDVDLSESDVVIQDYAANVLESILVQASANGSMVTKEKDEN
jgi:hypothetical protein